MKRRHNLLRRLGSLGAAFVFGLWVLGAGAQEHRKAPAAAPPKEDRPLRISASQLEADQNQRLITFLGHVRAEYGDSVLYADKLLVFYEGSSQAPAAPERGPSVLGEVGGERLRRLEARGNVRFVQGNRIATAEEAIYNPHQEEVVLLGRPQLWQGDNRLQGSRILIKVRSRKVVVESSPHQRVEAYLYPHSVPSRGERGGLGPPPAEPPGPPEGRRK